MISTNRLVIAFLSLIGFCSYNAFSQDDFVQINYIHSFDNLTSNDNKLDGFSGIEVTYSYPFLDDFFVKADAAIMFYNEGRYFNSKLIEENFTPYTFNLNANYIFSDFFENLHPLVLAGFGYTHYNSKFGGVTFNYGAGVQYWFNDTRINKYFNKIGLNSRIESRSFFRNSQRGNYIIASLGVSFLLY